MSKFNKRARILSRLTAYCKERGYLKEWKPGCPASFSAVFDTIHELHPELLLPRENRVLKWDWLESACNALRIDLNKTNVELRIQKIQNKIKKKLSVFSDKKKSQTQLDYEAFVISDAFLESFEWRKLRMEVLKRYGARCACCGATRADGVKIHVDHIKPRRKYPELALDINNLQPLCEVCNHGKGNWDETDWRNIQPGKHETELDQTAKQHIHSI